MGLFKKTKTLIIILIILNIIAGGAYWFMSRKIDGNKQKVSDLATKLDIQVKKEKQFQSFSNILDETVEEREELNSFFVEREGVVSFIQEIENLADIGGLSLEIGSVEIKDFIEGVEEKTVNNFVELLNINMTTSGTWGQSLYFLELIENIPMNIVVNRFTLNVERDGSGETIGWESFIDLEVLKIK